MQARLTLASLADGDDGAEPGVGAADEGLTQGAGPFRRAQLPRVVDCVDVGVVQWVEVGHPTERAEAHRNPKLGLDAAALFTHS